MMTIKSSLLVHLADTGHKVNSVKVFIVIYCIPYSLQSSLRIHLLPYTYVFTRRFYNPCHYFGIEVKLQRGFNSSYGFLPTVQKFVNKGPTISSSLSAQFSISPLLYILVSVYPLTTSFSYFMPSVN
ncbi:unnamed protein product [Heterobilharzia americana]|nr:unnamed protein product [Heterobilharzia americana]CAH8563666.1 unnamed protein product [Heterobilharzia americana]